VPNVTMAHVRPRVRARDLVVLCGGLAVTAITVVALRAIPQINPTTVGLTLLLVVLGTATLGRLWIATVVAVVATAAYNFFFFPPVGTFAIADPQNWVAVIAFLIAAVIASHLSAAAQERTREAVARRNEVTRLFDLTRDVLLTTEAAGAIDALARHVARRFELSRIAICLPADQDWRIHQGGSEDAEVDPEALNNALARARGALEFDARHRTYGGHMRVPGGTGGVLIPLRHGTRAVGLLAAEAPELDLGTLDAVAGVVAIAIERTQLLDERETAELVRQRADLAATLLASLSHDLKTPLTAIRVAVENLRGDLSPDDRRAQAGAAITELERLNRLFQDILDMARIDAAAVHVERQWVTPSDVVDAAVAQVRHTLDGHRLRIEADAEMMVEIDPRVASVALSHLLENAAHYSPADRAIAVEARAEDGLRVIVTDEGPGLDPNELEHLFERFFRGRKARQLAPGTGMGLAITRGLLSAVGGRVWAENAPGAGARFTIVLPGRTRRPAASE
jgi:two-component system, OmpR family, sensor histidine kinase KdpD